MNNHDQLSDIIWRVLKRSRLGLQINVAARVAAGNIIAAGWRPPARTINTLPELQGMPIGSVLIEQPYNHVWIRHSERWHCSCDGTDVSWTSDEVFSDLGVREKQPLTVLWEPEETP